jgi:uncharacterized membrane protein HdeD (DUF308 family)
MHTDSDQRTYWPERAPLGRLLRREAGRWWWVPLVAGVSWLIIAWVVLRADVTSLAAVGVLVGMAFLLAAANEAAIAGFASRGWRVAHYLSAAVLVLGAAWAFVRPIDTFFALASVLGLILLLQGALYTVRGIALRDVSPYWSLELLSGVLLTLLGIWVSVSDRVFDLAGRTAFILLWVGLMALFRGFSDIVLAFSMLWVARRGDGSAPDRRSGGAPSDSASTTPDRAARDRRSTVDGSRPRTEAPSGSRG